MKFKIRGINLREKNGGLAQTPFFKRKNLIFSKSSLTRALSVGTEEEKVLFNGGRTSKNTVELCFIFIDSKNPLCDNHRYRKAINVNDDEVNLRGIII
jgi:hypothetical protein